jgi:hypothetical protein
MATKFDAAIADAACVVGDEWRSPMKTLSACFVASAVALASWGAAAPPASAQAQMTDQIVGIACPIAAARRTIINPLPQGWWTTPIVDQLSATRVAQVGGRLALVCIYGASGAIQRYAPDGAVCAAVPLGFRCRAAAIARGPQAGASQQALRSGRVLLSQNTSLDFDRGVVGDPTSADLLLQAEARGRLFLAPRNGAKFWVGDGSERTYAACAQSPFSTERIPLSALPVGASVCMRTNEGRIGRFRVEAVSDTTPPSVSIAFASWTS